MTTKKGTTPNATQVKPGVYVANTSSSVFRSASSAPTPPKPTNKK